MRLPLHGLSSRQDLPLPFEFVLLGAALAPWATGARAAGSAPGPSPDTRQTEEFSERAQHHQPAPFDIAGNAFSARPDIHERFINDD